MPPEVSLLKLTQPEAVAKLYERSHVIQDMLVPIERLEAAVQLFHKEFEVFIYALQYLLQCQAFPVIRWLQAAVFGKIRAPGL